MLRASATHIRFQSIHTNPIDSPSTIDTNSPNATHPYYKHNVRHHPIAFALKIDRVNIMLDAGCPLTFADPEQWLTAYAKSIDNVDGVLLSGPEITTCGAVPFLKKLRPSIDIVAMNSTATVGLYTVLSTFQNLFGNEKTFTFKDPRTNLFTTITVTAEDVYSAFKSIKRPFGFKAAFSPTTWAGRKAASGAASGLVDGNEELQVVEARPTHNGQCLGGYIWVLSYQTDEITYSPSFSTKPSNYLKTLTRTSMEAPSRCNILLTDATAASITSIPTPVITTEGSESTRPATNNSKTVDMDALMSAVHEGIRDDHDVIIPLDATIKGVEVLMALMAYFEKRYLRSPIVFLFPHAAELLETVRVETDCLNEAALGSDSDIFNRINCAKTVADTFEFKAPRVIVCDGADLDYGLGIEMLEELQRQSKPWTLCFTNLPAPWTNAGRIYAKFHPDIAQYHDVSGNPNISSGVVTKYICDSKKLDSVIGGSSVFNRGRVLGGMLELGNDNSIALSYTRRREYDKEEQALYVARREEAAAESERRRAIEARGGNSTIGGEHIVADAADVSDDDDEVDAATGPSPSKVERVEHTPGLFLPSHLSSFKTRHLVFPKVSNGLGESTAYGMALQDWERRIFATRGHAHSTADTGPSHQGSLRNELLEYAKMPAHIEREEKRQFSLVGCRCATVDLSNLLDVRGFLRFLKGFPSSKKVVFLRGSTVDTQSHIAAPLVHEQRSREALVSSTALAASGRRFDGRKGFSHSLAVQYFVQHTHAGRTIDLATLVAAYDVRLSPALASLAQRSLCKVYERPSVVDDEATANGNASAQKGSWDIGWLHGFVAPPIRNARQLPPFTSTSSVGGDVDADVEMGRPNKKKRVEFVDESGAVRTVTLAPKNLTAEEREQADVAALLALEEGGDEKTFLGPNTESSLSKGSHQSLAAGGESTASAGAEGSQHTRKAAAIKTLHPIPTGLEAQALLHMEQEGIVQGSVFVGGLSLPALRDQARDVHRNILAAIGSRAVSGSVGGGASGDAIASSMAMGGDGGVDMNKYQSLIRAINISAPDGSNMLSTELLTSPNEALVLGSDTVVRQQGGVVSAGVGRGDSASTSVLGDVAVEGLVSPNFFAVRELVYSQFARIL